MIGKKDVNGSNRLPMPEVSVQQHTEEQLRNAGAADIVVGILSYNNAGNIAGVTKEAQRALAASFPALRCVMVNADGGSKDGTAELAASAVEDRNDFVQLTYPVYPAQKISPETWGVPGKANAVNAVFKIAAELNAGACAIVDSSAASLSGDWASILLQPVTEQEIDFVAPSYVRQKYDGALLLGVIYPLIRALYGKRVHQPVGGEYALSGKLVRHLMKQPQPEADATNTGVDAWMTIQAITGNFTVAEACVGPRVLNTKEPAPEVSTILSQALSAVFTEMNRSATAWQRTRGSLAVPCFGPRFEPLPEPTPADPAPMLQSFRLGYQNLQDVYRLILPPASLMDLKRLLYLSPEAYLFDDMTWARVVYDFALAWRARIIDRDQLLRALTPVYLGWVASWVRSIRDAGPKEAQERLETLCLAYEAQKGYLISRWRWPDTFNP